MHNHHHHHHHHDHRPPPDLAQHMAFLLSRAEVAESRKEAVSLLREAQRLQASLLAPRLYPPPTNHNHRHHQPPNSTNAND